MQPCTTQTTHLQPHAIIHHFYDTLHRMLLASNPRGGIETHLLYLMPHISIHANLSQTHDYQETGMRKRHTNAIETTTRAPKGVICK